MKTIKLLITPYLLFFCFSIVNAQMADKSLKMSITYPDQDIYRLLDFQDIDYCKVNITGKEIKGKQYYVVMKEFTKGKLTNNDTLFNTLTSNYVKPVESDTLSFFIIAHQTKERDVKIKFGFEGYSFIKEFKNESSLDYDLKEVSWQFPIEIDKPFYAFSYILPYVKGSTHYYCAPAKSGKDIEKWGQEFGIEHYILIEMNFFE